MNFSANVGCTLLSHLMLLHCRCSECSSTLRTCSRNLQCNLPEGRLGGAETHSAPLQQRTPAYRRWDSAVYDSLTSLSVQVLISWRGAEWVSPLLSSHRYVAAEGSWHRCEEASQTAFMVWHWDTKEHPHSYLICFLAGMQGGNSGIWAAKEKNILPRFWMVYVLKAAYLASSCWGPQPSKQNTIWRAVGSRLTISSPSASQGNLRAIPRDS